jgi:hypothetical protein
VELMDNSMATAAAAAMAGLVVIILLPEIG